jgi:hypothetical protein
VRLRSFNSKLALISGGSLLIYLGVMVTRLQAITSHPLQGDQLLWALWGKRLKTTALDEFYGEILDKFPRDKFVGEHFEILVTHPDRMPTDVMIMKLMTFTYPALGIANFDHAWTWLYFGVGCLFFLISLFLLVSIVRKVTGSDQVALRVAVAFGFCPLFILAGAFWGSWESVALGLVLAGFRLLLCPAWWAWSLGGLFCALAVEERPHIGIVALVLAPLTFGSATAWRAVAFLLGGTGTAVGMNALVGVGTFWRGKSGSLFDLLHYSATEWNLLSRFGASLWQFHPTPMGRVHETTVFGLAPLWLAVVAVLVASAGAVYVSRRQTLRDRLMFVVVVLGMTWFLGFPSMTERFSYFPVVGLLVFTALANERFGWWLLLNAMVLGGTNVLAPLVANPDLALRALAFGFALTTALFVMWGRDRSLTVAMSRAPS